MDFAFAAFELAVPAAKVGFRPVSTPGQAVSAFSVIHYSITSTLGFPAGGLAFHPAVLRKLLAVWTLRSFSVLSCHAHYGIVKLGKEGFGSRSRLG